MQAFELDPVDTLFFRDARPMQAGAGSGGHGANWPVPGILHAGLRANLLTTAGVPRGARTISVQRQSGQRQKTIGSFAFQSLRTIGPFPILRGMLYLPAPRDIVPLAGPSPADGDRVAGLVPEIPDGAAPEGATNWPDDVSWLRGLASPAAPSKRVLPQWVGLDWMREYLAGIGPWKAPPADADQRLYDPESRIGIAVDSERGTARDGMLYAAEHLRLRPGVSLWFTAALGETEIEERPDGVDVGSLIGSHITLGGESRIARLRPSDCPDGFRSLPRPSGRRIKWVLATPAVFAGGWRPGWIAADTGRVMLPAGRRERQPGETRRQWRQHLPEATPIKARLVAVCSGKPLHFSGWDQDAGSPKPTMLAVPSGSVYYFEAEDDASATALAGALHGTVRSDVFGEKGLGFGFCGVWSEKTAR